jgi:hypothetical protein
LFKLIYINKLTVYADLCCVRRNVAESREVSCVKLLEESEADNLRSQSFNEAL